MKLFPGVLLSETTAHADRCRWAGALRSTPVRAGDLVKLAEIPDAFSPQFRGTGYRREREGPACVLGTIIGRTPTHVSIPANHAQRFRQNRPDRHGWRRRGAGASGCFAELAAAEGEIKPWGASFMDPKLLMLIALLAPVLVLAAGMFARRESVDRS